ncbi:MAG: TetR family transcriptional regulator C-terminal domain-containing protein [Saprospiraceae bacterium]|nr:TetR family transcriptional regulator C-terminal domain-containing protein [Saprospiraceae bacterium]
MRRKIHKEDILNAGLQLMFTNGYYATGIKEITESIKIPKGSFYNHFSNKEEFGLEVVKMYCDNGLEMYKSIFLDKKYMPLERVENFFSSLISEYSNELDFKLGCLMGNFSAELSDTNEKFRILLAKEFGKLENVISICLQEAQDNGSLNKKDSADQIAAFVLNSWHGAMIRMKSTGNSRPLEDCKMMIMNKILV